MSVLDWTTQRFTEAGIGAARLEAQLLLSHVLQCSRTQLYMNFDKPLAEAELAGYRGLIKRRLGGEPVAYLIGEHEFWGLPLFVDPHVLVPRPDTETVVEVAVKARADKAAPCRVLDLCTGSGAIALALAKELPAATVIATDVSAEAVAIATKNVERNGMSGRVEVRHGDLFAPIAGERFDVVAFNPPWLTTSDDRHAAALRLDTGLPARFAAQLGDHLASSGRAILVLSTTADTDGWLAPLRAEGFVASVLLTRDRGSEILTAWRVAQPAG